MQQFSSLWFQLLFKVSGYQVFSIISQCGEIAFFCDGVLQFTVKGTLMDTLWTVRRGHKCRSLYRTLNGAL